MDQFYVESGYVDDNYVGFQANITLGLSGYYEDGYIDFDYFEYRGVFATLTADGEIVAGEVVEANGTWTSQATLSALVGVIKNAESALSSAFTVSGTISHIEGADLFAFTEAAIAVAVNRIRDNNIAASSAFTIATDAERIQQGASDDSAEFSFSANIIRVRFTEAAVSAAFSLTGNLSSILRSAVTTSSTFSLTAEATRLTSATEADADLSSSTTVSITANKFTDVVSNQSSAFAQSVSANKIRNADAAITASATASVDISVTRDVNVSLSSTVSQSASALRIQQGNIALTGAFTPTLSVDVFKNSFAVLDVTASLSITSNVNKSMSAELLSAITLVADVGNIEQALISISSNFAFTANVRRIRFGQATVNSAFTQNVSGNRRRGFASTQSAVSTLQASGSLLEKYWISYIYPTDTATYSFGQDNEIDYFNSNVYSVHGLNVDAVNSNSDPFLIKHDKNGTIIWEKRLDINIASAPSLGQNVKIDSNGDVYVVTTAYESNSMGFTNTFLMKFNSSGALLWSKGLNSSVGSGNTQDYAVGLTIDSSNSVYITGLKIGTFTGSFIIKYDSSGTLQFRREIQNLFSIDDIKIGSDSSIYIVGQEHRITGTIESLVAKLNSTATSIVWQKTIDGDSSNPTSIGRHRLELDSNGDLIALMADSYYSPVLIKHSQTDGSVIWQKSVSDISNKSLALDSQNNIYIASTKITKLDSSGNYVFTRRLDYLTQPIALNAITILPDDSMFVSGNITDNEGIVVAKLPTNGTRTGSYGPTEVNVYDYESDTNTVANSSYTFSNGTYVTRAGDMTNVTYTVTVTDTSTITSDTYTLLNLVRASAAFNVSATLTASPSRAVFAQASISSSATVTARVLRIKQLASAVTAQAQLQSTALRIKRLAAAVSAQTSLTVQVQRNRTTNIAISSAFTQTTNNSRTRNNSSTISTAATVTATILRIKSSSINTDSLATALTAAAKIGNFLVTVEVQAQLTADPAKSATVACETNIIAVMSTVAAVTRENSAGLSAVTALTASITKIKNTPAALSSQFTANVQAVKTVRAVSAQNSNFAVTANNIRIRFVSANASAVFTQQTVGLRLKLFAVSLASNAQFLATVFSLVRFEANLTAFNSVLSAGQVLHLDEYNTYLIPAETRLYKIRKESRLYTIDTETRIYKIRGY